MPKQPNILLIQTDQQRADTVRALGNPIIQTPALDRLANEGAAFLSAYCPSPVCVASRCSLLLGQWPHRTGCHSNNPMPHDRVSLMQTLNEAGYQTHGIGKMHFSPKPRNLWGFESRDYSEEGSGMDDFRQLIDENGYDYIAAPQGERSEYYYIPQPSQLPARLHQTQWVGDKTLEFLERREPDRPFFCWSSFIKPHPPFENPVPWNRLYRLVEMPPPYMPDGYESLLTYWNRNQNRYKYRDQGFDMNLIRLTAAAYYGTISFIDYNVGRILNDLERRGLLDETLILFTSDHGELLGDYGSVGKRSMLDAAFRVPLLARYPARFAAGGRVETPASLVDIFPTCAAAAGLPFDRDGRRRPCRPRKRRGTAARSDGAIQPSRDGPLCACQQPFQVCVFGGRPARVAFSAAYRHARLPQRGREPRLWAAAERDALSAHGAVPQRRVRRAAGRQPLARVPAARDAEQPGRMAAVPGRALRLRPVPGRLRARR